MRTTLPFALFLLAAPVGAQSLMYRSPNLGGTWVADPGVVQFDFVHRFYVSPGPNHSVVNFPTFTLATGVTKTVGVGAVFATHSFLIQGASGSNSTNETQVFARWRAWGAPEGSAGLHVSVTPAYNLLAKSVDGELSLDWTTGALTVEGVGRYVAKPLGVASGARGALAAGIVARVNRYVAVSADVGSFLSPTVLAAWSAGLQIVIPGSPHTFAFEVSDAYTSTIQGNSIGQRTKLYGFEFTIPFRLKRFGQLFHPAPAVTAQAPAGTTIGAEITIGGFRFQGDTVTISAGQAVRWTNGDPVEHTITFDDGTGSSLIPQHGGYARRFDQPGTYTYHCTPHPYMKGVVVVK
jgi:plastocyanin